MIRRLGNVFLLDTPNTTYAFGVIPSGQLEHLYYGERIQIDTEEETTVLAEKRLSLPGNTVAYSSDHKDISLEVIRLEMSGGGKGDIREPFIEVTHADGSYTSYETDSSETISQVMVALCQLGISMDDDRFVVDGKTLTDRLLAYRTEDGTFKHTMDGEGDMMATEQAFYALVGLHQVEN